MTRVKNILQINDVIFIRVIVTRMYIVHAHRYVVHIKFHATRTNTTFTKLSTIALVIKPSFKAVLASSAITSAPFVRILLLSAV